MARILAVDYGRKRVGLAVTDTLKISANGLTTVHAKDVYDYLENYFQSQPVELVLVGYPKQMNNQPSESIVFVKEFITRFKKRFKDMPIELVDERFTSKMAFQAMIDGGLSKKKRSDKGLIDKISATIMLQSYLESLDYKKTI